MFLDGKTILITGGTGSFGKKMISTIYKRAKPRRVIVFSRDELKQFEMAHHPDFSPYSKTMRYFIGDVREVDRLRIAMRNKIDIVIHAAALKQVPACEYNPFEAVKTNVLGAQNVATAAIESNVEKVLALSTDKAAAPINLYGATKLCSDKLFIASNSMVGPGRSRLSIVRYGNVVGSRGSVIPFFLDQARKGETLTITDPRMTRFSITLQEGANFVLNCLEKMQGGEIFIPKIPSYRIVDVAEAVAPKQTPQVIGIRPGEKLHEVMITEDDSRHAVDCGEYYVLKPASIWRNSPLKIAGEPCPDGFVYSSGTNDRWLSVEDIRNLARVECEGLQHGGK